MSFDLTLSGKRVLLAASDEKMLNVIQQQLASWQVEEQAASSGYEALGLLGQAGPFDALIVAQSLPGIDGLTLIQKLRCHPKLATLPVVLIVDQSEQACIPNFNQTIKALTAVEYLERPVRQSSLYNLLMQALVLPESTVLKDGLSLDLPASSQLLAEQYPLKILAAEDNLVNQQLVYQWLSKLGYRIDFANNGVEVLEALRRQPYDVVLMDVQMPEMDGLQASQEICQQWSDDERPFIIAMTANAMQGDRDRCLSAGMDDYISKPIRAQELRDALERCALLRQKKRPSNHSRSSPAVSS